MPSRFSIGLATVVMLVLLRLNIGWHFFSEGVKHYADPHWTSEPVLRGAKGPLAPLVSRLPARLSRLRATCCTREPTAEADDARRAKPGSTTVEQRLGRRPADGSPSTSASTRNKPQQADDDRCDDYQAKLRAWAGDNRDALATHVHEWHRKENAEATRRPADVPFQQATRRRQSRPRWRARPAAGWPSCKHLESDYDDALGALLDRRAARAAAARCRADVHRPGRSA